MRKTTRQREKLPNLIGVRVSDKMMEELESRACALGHVEIPEIVRMAISKLLKKRIHLQG